MPNERELSTLVFGLSTTPIAEIKSELRKEIERSLLKLVYADKK